MSRPRRIGQIVLLVVMAAAAIRLYLTIRERRVELVPAKPQTLALDADAYVTPRKLHPQDLKDAKELTQQPAVWVREGYRFTYYPFNGHPDFAHPAGTLGPIEKLRISDVVLVHSPRGVDEKQIMAIFDKDGQRCAFSIGAENHGTYEIYSDDVLFVQDPRELYKHWPADIWQAIDHHEVTPGMNELQASFAVGMGTPEGSGLSDTRIVNYPNNGHPLRITFTRGKATTVEPPS